jgi:hypothetical protein
VTISAGDFRVTQITQNHSFPFKSVCDHTVSSLELPLDYEDKPRANFLGTTVDTPQVARVKNIMSEQNTSIEPTLIVLATVFGLESEMSQAPFQHAAVSTIVP